ncbi:hypothetical protein B566_EDAN017216 [Ephemera danica]|nr:hypothetical protein B566_EDAN017216 [Ephemera danica]
MNLIGAFMWLAVGGTCLHYWNDYQNESMYIVTSSEKKFGIAVGSLCIVEGVVFIVDTLLSFRIHWEQNQ